MEESKTQARGIVFIKIGFGKGKINMKIKDLPKIDRPCERFLEKGPDALSKSELLAIILGSGIPGKNVQELAKQIIQRFGAGKGVRNLFLFWIKA